MSTTQLQELAGVLEQINEATAELRRSEQVPESVAQLVDDLDAKLHADAPLRLDVDPYLSTMLFAGALRAVKGLRHDSAKAQRRDVRIALEQVRHALRDIVDRAPAADDVPVREVLTTLSESVGVPQKELAELLGVSTRQLQRWLTGDVTPVGDDEARIRIVAQIVNHLRHVFTAPGVVAWFVRVHPRLEARPIELLDEPAAYPELRGLAAASRSMAG